MVGNVSRSGGDTPTRVPNMTFYKRKNSVCIDTSTVFRFGAARYDKKMFHKFLLNDLKVDPSTLVDIQVHGLQKFIFIKFNNPDTATEIQERLSAGVFWEELSTTVTGWNCDTTQVMLRILNVSPETGLTEVREELEKFGRVRYIARNRFREFGDVNVTDGTISARIVMDKDKDIPRFIYKEETDWDEAEVWQVRFNGQGKTGCWKCVDLTHIGNFCKKFVPKRNKPVPMRKDDGKKEAAKGDKPPEQPTDKETPTHNESGGGAASAAPDKPPDADKSQGDDTESPKSQDKPMEAENSKEATTIVKKQVQSVAPEKTQGQPGSSTTGGSLPPGLHLSKSQKRKHKNKTKGENNVTIEDAGQESSSDEVNEVSQPKAKVQVTDVSATDGEKTVIQAVEFNPVSSPESSPKPSTTKPQLSDELKAAKEKLVCEQLS